MNVKDKIFTGVTPDGICKCLGCPFILHKLVAWMERYRSGTVKVPTSVPLPHVAYPNQMASTYVAQVRMRSLNKMASIVVLRPVSIFMASTYKVSICIQSGNDEDDI